MMRLLMKKLNKIHFNCRLTPVPVRRTAPQPTPPPPTQPSRALLKQSKIKNEKKKIKNTNTNYTPSMMNDTTAMRHLGDIRAELRA